MGKRHWSNLEKEFLYYASLIKEKEQSIELIQMIAAGKIAIDRIKILREYAEEIADRKKRSEFMKILADLNLEFAEIKDKLIKPVEENSSLQKRIIDFKERKENQELKKSVSQLILKDGLYYKADNNDGPFCTHCYDNNQKIIRIRTLPPTMQEFGKHECLLCRTVYR